MTTADPIAENARLRALLSRAISPDEAGLIDVVITANEINGRHGTGLLLQRILDSAGVFSIRSRNDWGPQHFGRENARIAQEGTNRQRWVPNVLRVLAGREIGNALCVPYLPDEVATAIAIGEHFGAKLCAYIMDDQNVTVSGIPDSMMREFLEKCSLRLATHPELRKAYEQKYGLKFSLLPAGAPDALILREPAATTFLAGRAAMIGGIWEQSWFDQLCAALEESHWKVDWFGNHQFWSVDAAEAKLHRAGIAAHGVIPEARLARELRAYPLAIVPVADGRAPRAELALSLPGRILFTMATSGTPLLIVGSEQSCAARFVRHFGIGTVAPYEARKIAAAMEWLCDSARQLEMRERAAALGPAFTDRGVKEWLRASIELGRPADDRFENAFAGYNG